MVQASAVVAAVLTCNFENLIAAAAAAAAVVKPVFADSSFAVAVSCSKNYFAELVTSVAAAEYLQCYFVVLVVDSAAYLAYFLADPSFAAAAVISSIAEEWALIVAEEKVPVDVRIEPAVVWQLIVDSTEATMELTVEFDSVDSVEAQSVEQTACFQLESAEY